MIHRLEWTDSETGSHSRVIGTHDAARDTWSQLAKLPTTRMLSITTDFKLKPELLDDSSGFSGSANLDCNASHFGAGGGSAAVSGGQGGCGSTGAIIDGQYIGAGGAGD